MSPDDTTTKRCTKCGEWKPAAQFSKDRTKKDGLHTQCKSCRREYEREYAEHRREYKSEYNRKYYQQNTERALNYAREYYQQNTERAIKYQREYRRENAERRSEQKRGYYQENIERIREYRTENAGHIRDCAREYRKTPRGRAVNTAAFQRRRARKRGLANTFTPADWQAALNYFGGCCAVCGRPQGLWHTLAADHWIPLNSPDCPGTVPSNIVPLCHGTGGCNNSKKSRPATEWLIDKFGKRKGREILKRIETFLDSNCLSS